MKKPVIGNLVVINWEEISMDERGMTPNDRFCKPGIIIKREGTRCRVFWPDGKVTRPERRVLKILA